MKQEDLWGAALELAASTIELFDDATMKGDYMLDASECAAIIRALKTMHPAPAVAVNEQMLNALRLYIAHASEPECAIWRHVHSQIHAAIAAAAAQALAATPEPAPMVRLTEYELVGLMYDTNALPECQPQQRELVAFASAVQSAMIAKNGGKQ